MRELLLKSGRGTRFSHTRYYPNGIGGEVIHLDRKNVNKISKEYPIHRSIRVMDHEGMNILGSMSGTNSVHGEFAKYLSRTGNTICGRHPIGMFLGAIESLKEGSQGRKLKWVRYEQSSECETIKDSSVSYASGYIIL